MVGEMTERNILVYTTPEKRRIWISIVLSIFGSGLPMIYCGRLKQGIIVEAAIIAIYFLLFVLLTLIPEFLMVLIITLMAVMILLGLLVYNIKLTIETNRRKVQRLNGTWKTIIMVWISIAIVSKGVSYLIKTEFIEAYKIPATSMENALYVGDYLMATKSIKPDEIRDGDLIIFKYPGDPRYFYKGKGTNYIKRVILKIGIESAV